MISVVLVGPEHPGNVGAVARACANFDVAKLLILCPSCDCRSSEARARAMEGRAILEKARIADDTASLKSFDIVVGTTARLGTDYNIRRSPLTPGQLAQKLSMPGVKRRRVALVFGRESEGLHNDEIALCDFMVTIPSSKKYASLNLSHAVAVMLYELRREDWGGELLLPYAPASSAEKERLFALIDDLLDRIDFPTPEKRRTQKVVWRHVLGKSLMTKREALRTKPVTFISGQGESCLPYATQDFVDTGHGWMTPKGKNTGSLSATIYAILAYYGLNPLELAN